jgi:hypothetical protein
MRARTKQTVNAVKAQLVYSPQSPFRRFYFLPLCAFQTILHARMRHVYSNCSVRTMETVKKPTRPEASASVTVSSLAVLLETEARLRDTRVVATPDLPAR